MPCLCGPRQRKSCDLGSKNSATNLEASRSPARVHDAFPATVLALPEETGSKLIGWTFGAARQSSTLPTDATLLWDSVRTITRLVGDLDDKLPNGVKGFTNHTRSARRRMQQLQRMTAQQRQQQQQQQEPKYRELLRITGQVVQNARQVVEQTKRCL